MNGKRKQIILSIIILAFFGLLFFGFQSVFAQDTFGLQPIDQNVALGGQDIRVIIAKIIRVILGLIGVIALGIVLYGGFIYMTSEGNEEKITQARKILINGVIGLAIILSAFSITQFILSKLSQATGTGFNPPQSCTELVYSLDCGRCIECNGKEVCSFSSCNEEQNFVVKSITPKSNDTGMNNVVARVVFSRPLKSYQKDDVEIYQNGNKLNASLFDFELKGNNYVVEAKYKNEIGKCDDSTPCLDFGSYQIKVNFQIIDSNGNKLIASGDFPLQADFVIPIKAGIQTEKYLNFAGDNSYVDVGQLKGLGNLKAITVSAWVRRTDNAHENGGIIGKWNSASSSSTNSFLLYNGGADNKGSFSLFFDNDKLSTIRGGTSMNIGEWYFLAATWDSTTGVMNFYKNGKLETKLDQPGSVGSKIKESSEFSAMIGAWGRLHSSVHRFAGDIDRVAIYKRALSAEEIGQIFQEGEGRNKEFVSDEKNGLFAGWNFDESANNLVSDVSGNNHSGTYSGGATLKEDSIVFDGLNDLARSQNKFTFGDISFSAWVKPNFFEDNDYHVLTLLSAGDQGKEGFRFLNLTKYKDNNVIYLFWQYGNGGDSSVFSLPLGQKDDLNGRWLHVAISHSQNLGAIDLYLNGEKKSFSEKLRDVKSVNVVNKPLRFGYFDSYQDTGYNNHFFRGEMDNIRVYNRVLSAEEAKQIYNGGRNYSTEENKNGIIGLWNFDQSLSDNLVQDLSGNGNKLSIPFGVKANSLKNNADKIKDQVAPVLSAVIYATSPEGEAVGSRLERNKTYYIRTNITDKAGDKGGGGVGYVHLKLEKINENKSKSLVKDFYDGPKVSRGSDAPDSKPYNFVYAFPIPKNSIVPQTYEVTIEAYDIDNNHRSVTSQFTVVDEQCIANPEKPGCGCIDDGCICKNDDNCAYGYKCLDLDLTTDDNENHCYKYPLIEKIDPLDGAAGNWVSIIGRNFLGNQTNVGTVNFIYSDAAGKKQTVNVPVAVCNGKGAWKDKLIVAEIPEDVILPSGSKSETVVNVAYQYEVTGGPAIQPLDSSLNSETVKWGPQLGLFTKNDIVRPGLCDIRPSAGAPDTPVVITGKNLGKATGNLFFGSYDGKVASWSEGAINSTVPNMKDETVGVYVEDSIGRKSNGIPFTVGRLGQDLTPIISSMDPASTTPGSYFTIFGSHFGETIGLVCMANQPGAPCNDSCNVQSGCIFANPSLPNFCGDTWDDQQIIVQVPMDFPASLASYAPIYNPFSAVFGNKSLPYEGKGFNFSDNNGNFAVDAAFKAAFDFQLNDVWQDIKVGESLSRVIFQKEGDLKKDGEDGYVIEVIDSRDEKGNIKRILKARGKDGGGLEFEISPSTSRQFWEINITPNGKPAENGSNNVQVDLEVKYKNIQNQLVTVVTTTDFNLNPDFKTGKVSIGGLVDGSHLLNGKIYSIIFQKGDLSRNKKLYVSVKRGDNNLSSNGNDVFQVTDGSPKPSICLISPKQGPAPLPNGKYLTIRGANFSLNPQIRFWWKQANKENINSWLQSVDFKAIDNTYITSTIPVDAVTWYSMPKGPNPIKVVSDQNQESNGYNYTVTSCNDSDSLPPDGQVTNSAYHCCEDGADKGMWRPNSVVCEGEKRDAGYVWRFTSGILNDAPFVVEYCDQNAWSTTNLRPSPSPFNKWNSRSNVNSCLNAVVSLRFSKQIKEASINQQTVKVYECASRNCDGNSEPKEVKDLDLRYFSTNYGNEPAGGVEIIIPPPNLEKNKWYQIELLPGIVSQVEKNILGNATTTYTPLEKNIGNCAKLINTKADYCFDFQTGDGFCQLLGAGMNPALFTTHILGILQDERYPFSTTNRFVNVPHKKYYTLWGKADQECTTIDVDGLGWKWGSSDANKATSDVALTTAAEEAEAAKRKLKITKYTDSRGYVTAWANTYPQDVEIIASTTVAGTELIQPTQLNIGGISVLESAGIISDNGYDLYQEGQNKSVAINNSDFNLTEPFTLEIAFQVNENVGEKASRLIFKSGAYTLMFPSGSAGAKGLCFVTPPENVAERIVVCNNEKPQIGKKYHYIIIWNGKTLSWYSKNGLIESAPMAKIFSSSTPLYIGSLAISSDAKIYDLRIVKGEISQTAINNIFPPKQKKTITATSSLTIDLSNPRVVEYWPNCGEACINAGIGVRFNMEMVTSTFKNNIKLYQCSDETCESKNLIQNNLDLDAVDVYSDSFNLKTFVKMGEWLGTKGWYMVEISDSDASKAIRAVGAYVKETDTDGRERITEIKPGKPLPVFRWKFRTKNDDQPCLVNTVRINPDPFFAIFVGEKTVYKSLPFGMPDQCSPYGQELNPLGYSWKWEVADVKVATTTHFGNVPQNQPYCGQGCLLEGSDIPRSESSIYICGNGIVEPGEDCDIATGQPFKEIAGVSCSLNCLRLGNKYLAMASSTKSQGLCGDGFVSAEKGEECDFRKAGEENYCNSNCNWKGSSQIRASGTNLDTPWCGSGSVTIGEECDLGLNGAVGCNSKCLHSGTILSKDWAFKHQDDAYSSIVDPVTQKSTVIKIENTNEYRNAVSVCGNKIIEKNEECEIIDGVLKINGLTGEYNTLSPNVDVCSDRCILKNLCNQGSLSNASNPFYCQKDSEGCLADCTRAGSSVLYSDSSMCGDGKIGIGEYGGCEVIKPVASVDEGSIQLVTAVGETSRIERILSQTTTIFSTAVKYWNGTAYSNKYSDGKNFVAVRGEGDYELLCGRKEFEPTEADNRYNDCATDRQYDFGVGANSCCYNRAKRISEYPKHGQGLTSELADLVCPNTYIEIKFDQAINAQTIENNYYFASAHDAGFVCNSTGQTDVTDSLKKILALQDASYQSFWGKIWHYIKKFFADLIGQISYADDPAIEDLIKNNVWCAGKITAKPEVANEDGKISSTGTVKLYLNNLMDFNTTYALVFEGGAGGMKDVRGVGIRAKIENRFNDIILFKTGKQICKIKSVFVSPEKWLFDAPDSKKVFAAVASSTNDQLISPTPGYSWEWSWTPEKNNLFDFQNNGNSQTASSSLIIASKNVEGRLLVSANAHIVTDMDKNSNQQGRYFIGSTDLIARFCVNPWPSKEQIDFEDDVFNFRMNYCADAGKSGDKSDDLPFFDKIFVVSKIGDPFKMCNLELGDVCTLDSECNQNLYQIPGSGVLDLKDKKLCYKNNQLLSGNKLCTVASDCYTATDLKMIDNSGKCKYSGVACSNDNNCVDEKKYYQMNNGQTLALAKNEGICVDGAPEDGPGSEFPSFYKQNFKVCNVIQGIGCEGSAPFSECVSIEPMYEGAGTLAVNVCQGQIYDSNSYSCSLPAEEYKNKCVTTEIPGHNLTEDTLKRYIFFASTTDDAIGLQVFANTSSLSASEWYESKKFTGNVKQEKIGGYDAVTDGTNYYVSGLNFVPDEDGGIMWSNIFEFSLSQGAQKNSQNVFAMLLESLEYNTNLTDRGYCLKRGETSDIDNGDLYVSPNLISEITCSTDFECRDVNGAPKNGTTGVCSNVKTKIFRDYNERLPKIKGFQETMKAYCGPGKSKACPDLRGGTYIPGYTVSKWGTSWGMLSAKVGNLPADPINKWTSCGDLDADLQTCWNASKTTYSCPAYSSVFEYEFVSSTLGYKLHAPLEYFKITDQIVEERLDLNFFSSDPICRGAVLSPFAGQCGDGVVQPGEECDPPGYSKLSNIGYRASKLGRCKYTYNTAMCATKADCPYSKVDIYTVDLPANAKTCQYDGVLLYGKSNDKREAEVFSCNDDGDCITNETYGEDGKKFFTVDDDNEFVVSNDLFLVPGDKFKCREIRQSAGFDATQTGTAECSGAVTEGLVNCAIGEAANTLCNLSCKWDRGACLSTVECGNGKVEGDEVCDDGPLNGTYGHCAGVKDFYVTGRSMACKDLHPQYCGNYQKTALNPIIYSSKEALLDKDVNGKPLEFCEFTKIPDEKFVSLRVDSGYLFNGKCASVLSISDVFNQFYLQFGSLAKQISNIPKSPIIPVEKLAYTNCGLNPTGDCDNDQVPNSSDNCQMVKNSLADGVCSNDLSRSCQIEYTRGNENPVAQGCRETDAVCLSGRCNNNENLRCDPNNSRLVETYCGDPKAVCSQPVFRSKEQQLDKDGDGVGDACDNCLEIKNGFCDEKYPNTLKNCVSKITSSQLDSDGDGVGDACDSCPDVANAGSNQNIDLNQNGRNDYCDDPLKTALNKIFGSVQKSWIEQLSADKKLICENYKGFCSNNSSYACRTDKDCAINADAMYVENNIDLQAFVSGLTSSAVSTGTCVYSYRPYSPDKEYSCSWDCQNFGSYCGDGIKDQKEACDDGNKIDTDNCKNDCTVNTSAYLCGNKIVEKASAYPGGTEDCDVGMKCDNGLDCTPKWEAASQTWKSNAGICKGIGTGECKVRNDLKNLCSGQCEILENENICGNGIIDPSLDSAYNEVCDMGAKNGEKCVPNYGSSCTYCSTDCKKILTIDRQTYCGNGKIDIIKWNGLIPVIEACDKEQTTGKIFTGQYKLLSGIEETEMICPDKGVFECNKDCTELKDSCVSCGPIFEGGLPAKVGLLNPVIGDSASLDASSYSDPWMQNNSFSLYRYSTKTSKYLLNFPSPLSPSYDFSVKNFLNRSQTISNANYGLQQNSICNGEYKIIFNPNKIFAHLLGHTPSISELYNATGTVSLSDVTDIFDYRVNDEKVDILNEYIISPTIEAEGIYRVVVKYGKIQAKAGANFFINVYNPALNYGLVVNSLSATFLPTKYISNKTWCDHTDLSTCLNSNFEKIYIHPPFAHLEETYINSVTIDTRGKEGEYAIFISQNTLMNKDENNEDVIDPIYNYRNQDIEVYLYKYNPKNIIGSVYEPNRVFSISLAESGQAQTSAKYWHVFNLTNKNGKFDLSPVTFVDQTQNITQYENGRILENTESIAKTMSGYSGGPSFWVADETDLLAGNSNVFDNHADGSFFMILEADPAFENIYQNSFKKLVGEANDIIQNNELGVKQYIYVSEPEQLKSNTNGQLKYYLPRYDLPNLVAYLNSGKSMKMIFGHLNKDGAPQGVYVLKYSSANSSEFESAFRNGSVYEFITAKYNDFHKEITIWIYDDPYSTYIYNAEQLLIKNNAPFENIPDGSFFLIAEGTTLLPSLFPSENWNVIIEESGMKQYLYFKEMADVVGHNIYFSQVKQINDLIDYLGHSKMSIYFGFIENGKPMLSTTIDANDGTEYVEKLIYNNDLEFVLALSKDKKSWWVLDVYKDYYTLKAKVLDYFSEKIVP